MIKKEFTRTVRNTMTQAMMSEDMTETDTIAKVMMPTVMNARDIT